MNTTLQLSLYFLSSAVNGSFILAYSFSYSSRSSGNPGDTIYSLLSWRYHRLLLCLFSLFFEIIIDVIFRLEKISHLLLFIDIIPYDEYYFMLEAQLDFSAKMYS